VAHPAPVDELTQLRTALASRPAIDLAKGVLMAVLRCNADTAFAELARVSMEGNIKVARVAELVVEQVVLPRPAGTMPADVPVTVCAAVERWVRALSTP
jgi:hypothetical protein